MRKLQSVLLNVTMAGIVVLPSTPIFAEELDQLWRHGKAYADLRLRQESVSQDNALKDASALTLRSRLGYATGAYQNVSATLEVEDSRIVAGRGDYSVGPTGYQPGQYSVIADPETTELDQGFLQYKSKVVAAKLGRQVITYDNHRFVGHVGWRQDRQTFDALTIALSPLEKLKLNYAFIKQRNRIFAEEADVDAKDHLLNASFQSAVGKLTGYSYLLEVEETGASLDTLGVRFTGKHKAGGAGFLYGAEFARQKSKTDASEFSANYSLLEAGVSVVGVTAKLAYEVLGSDEGNYGFSTPLATLHKFNGWADQFLATPAQGLRDLTLSLSGKLLTGKWMIAYHDYKADSETAAVSDLGKELNASYSLKFAKYYSVGLKLATYTAGDAAVGKVDTDKAWFWLGASF